MLLYLYALFTGPRQTDPVEKKEKKPKLSVMQGEEEPSETSTESQIEPVEETSEKYITNINNNIYLCTFGVDSYISFSFV